MKLLLVALLILVMASIQDARERSIFLGYPLALIGIGIINVMVNKVNITVFSFALFAIILIGISLVTKQAVGMGDSLIMIGLSLLCGIKGCVFIISTMCIYIWVVMSGISLYKLVNRKEKTIEKSIPLIPFISLALGTFILER